LGKVRTTAILGLTSLLVAGAAVHNVSTAVTEEDVYYGSQILERAGYNPDPGAFGDLNRFENQIATILAVQDAVLKAAPIWSGLAHGRPREPKDVLTEGMGKCFNRSRAMEKILAVLGFETRHLAIYSTRIHGRLRTLMTPGGRSHAGTEVKTEKGWILIDSDARWIGLDSAANVYTAKDLQGRDVFAMDWAAEVPEPFSWLYMDRPFTYVVGLFSRHGGFFAPYTPVPDVNYGQLLQNIY
jgi:hypothetical protein